MNSYKIATL